MNFSQRKGLQPLPERLRPDQMPAGLRVSLWNALHISIWDSTNFMLRGGHYGYIMGFAKDVWFRHFKLPFSQIPKDPFAILRALEKSFFNCQWNEVYDFIEAVLDVWESDRVAPALNGVLEREIAAYRIVGKRIVEITDEKELAAVEEALVAGDRFASVATHFQRALELLSDRTNPDFRNSIKESISAVEAAARIITGSESATLGDALKVLERNQDLHKALKEGFLKLYGYTSDEDGIRHAMNEAPSLGMAEAKYFLLSCTSFVNYLRSRLGEAA